MNGVREMVSFSCKKEDFYDDSRVKYNDFYIEHGDNIPWGSGYLLEEDYRDIFLKYCRNFGRVWLDMGCGYSPFLPYVKNDGNISYFGVDIAQSVIEKNRERFPSKNIHFVEAEVSDFLMGNTKQFSTIIDIGCLHCTERMVQKEIIESYKNILHSRGYLFLRFFDATSHNAPVFFIEETIPIWGVQRHDILEYLGEMFTLLEEREDTHQFNLTKRTTLLLQKN